MRIALGRGFQIPAIAGLVLAALLACHAAPARADIHLVWDDQFSADEQAKLTSWLRETYAGLESLVGKLPMGVTAHMHRRDHSREPVPWAHTERDNQQGVHFYVDPGFSLQAFRHDWTAPHELSHLILPYVGRGNAWFAEGFASFMQYQVMEAMGVLSEADAARRYREHLERAASGYGYPRQSFVEAAPKLRASRQYPVMYWGGAAYFLQVDQALRDSGTSLAAVLRDYVRCCRQNRDSLSDLIARLDRLSGSQAFSGHYARFSTDPGFPRFQGTVSD